MISGLSIVRAVHAGEMQAEEALEHCIARIEVTDPKVEEFLRNYMTEFHGFIARVYTVLPRST